MTEIEKLFVRVNQLNYPNTMKKIAGEIRGISFFPGGKGTYENDGILSNKKLMILGQDFDCEKSYEISLKNGEENINKNPTWRNLCKFLTDINELPQNCFFTNGIMGIRKGSISTGKSPAFRDKKFIHECQRFFLYQIEMQKPKAIFLLGKYVAEFLAFTSGEFALTSNEIVGWKKIENFTTIDKQNNQIKKDVIFSNGIKTNLVILTHPSYRHANIHRRSFEGHTSYEAEIKMTQEVL